MILSFRKEPCLVEWNIPTVMGNYDESGDFGLLLCGCYFPTDEACLARKKSLAWTGGQVAEPFLRGLPRGLWFDFAAG